MHLDTVLTQVDYDRFTVYPGILGTMQVFRITRGTHEGELAVEEVSDSLDRVLARILHVPAVQLIRCGGGDSVAAAADEHALRPRRPLNLKKGQSLFQVFAGARACAWLLCQLSVSWQAWRLKALG